MRGGHDRAVEALVAGHPRVAAGDLLAHELERRAQRGEVRVGPAAGGEPRRVGLDRLARLVDRGQVRMALDEPLGQRAEQIVGVMQEVDAVAVADLDDAAHAQRGERLADARAADPEACGELALGDEAVARLELLGADERLEALDDALVEGLAAGRLQHPGEV